MNLDWWKAGWQSAYQTVHSRIDDAWCYSKYWHHPSSDLLVVLLHGQLANSHWWRPIAGMLAQDHSVLAVDFSGMGDSQWRDTYSFDLHVKEVKHVIELMAKKHVVTIGHSYGGLVGLSLASHHQKNHLGHMMIDSPLTALFDDQRSSSSQSSRLKAQIVHYQSQEAICERFRIVPPQPILIESLANAVAIESSIQDEQGWRWKFDPNVLALSHPGGKLSTDVKTKLAYIAGGSSVFWSESYKKRLEACDIDLRVIPEGYHALPLDVPEDLYIQINQQLDRMVL
jgi:pimeloyl-ACP methyl ester carboxylesterase